MRKTESQTNDRNISADFEKGKQKINSRLRKILIIHYNQKLRFESTYLSADIFNRNAKTKNSMSVQTFLKRPNHDSPEKPQGHKMTIGQTV